MFRTCFIFKMRELNLDGISMSCKLSRNKVVLFKYHLNILLVFTV